MLNPFHVCDESRVGEAALFCLSCVFTSSTPNTNFAFGAESTKQRPWNLIRSQEWACVCQPPYRRLHKVSQSLDRIFIARQPHYEGNPTVK